MDGRFESTFNMDEGQDLHDFGKCCSCEEEKKNVNNFIMLPFRTPIEGTGWGCFSCGIKPNGAMAVVCDECFVKLNKKEAEIKFIVYGYPVMKERKSLENYIKIPFMHDPTLHDQYDGWTATVPE